MIGVQTGLSEIEGPFAVAEVNFRLDDRDWTFGQDNQAEIAAWFAALKADNPTLFNGPMLLADRWALVGDVLQGRLCRTDFASFLFWRDAHAGGRLDDLAGTRNLFGAAAVRSSEGYLLVAEMAAHTANAGRVYGPCGSLDSEDVVDGRIDIDGSMARELAEETGLDLDEAAAAPGYLVWFDGPRLAVIRQYRFAADAKALTARVRAFLAAQTAPELAAIRFVTGASDIETARMPDYTVSMVRRFFGGT